MLNSIFDKHIKQVKKVFIAYMTERQKDNTQTAFKFEIEVLAENDEKAINKYLIPAELFRVMDYKIPVVLFKIGSRKALYALSTIKHNRQPNTAVFKLTIVDKTVYELTYSP